MSLKALVIDELIARVPIIQGGLIGFNIIAANFRYYDRYVKRCVEIGADVIISGASLQINLPELVEGSKTKIAPIVSSNKGVKVLLILGKAEKLSESI